MSGNDACNRNVSDAGGRSTETEQRSRYDTIKRCYFNVRSKANMSQLNLPHN